MVNRLSMIGLLIVIKTLDSHLLYNPQMYRGREEVLEKYDNLQQERSIEILEGSGRRRTRSVNDASNESQDKSSRTDCIPSTTAAPFFFLHFGNSDWLNPQNNNNNRGTQGGNSRRQEEDKKSGRRYDGRQPCDYYQQTTQKLPFQGGLYFGSPQIQNPFTPNRFNRNNEFNFFQPNNENNPLLRGGGIVIGSPPFLATSTEKHERAVSREVTPVNKAKFWCAKYRSKCRSKERPIGLKPRIIGGRPASPRDHTHMVMVGYGAPDDKHWLCGGSLISTKYVLTAAHCRSTGIWGRARWARLGELDVSSRSEDARPQERIITKFYIYPEYREPAVYHDIALFKLDNDVTLTEWVSPICLYTSREISVLHVVVTGWGRTDIVSETSPVLREVEIGLYNNTECKKLMNKTRGNTLPRGIDTNVMLCAGVGQGGKDACSGDSGGPLIIETEACSKVQIGITSVGRDCGLPNSPGVYTRVSHYVQWIESIVWP